MLGRDPHRVLCGVAAALALTAGSSLAAAEPAPPKPAATAATGLPKLEVEKFTIDLGEIRRGDNAEAVFVLRNHGDAVLKVLSAQPT